VPSIAGTGWFSVGLEDEHRVLLQRFDPSAQHCAERSYDFDTIGFFIAKFVKLE